jgi:hypothetical protein
MENKPTPHEALSFGRDFLSAGKKSPCGSNPTLRTNCSCFSSLFVVGVISYQD